MRAKCNIVSLRAERANNFDIFLTFAPPIRKIDRCPCLDGTCHLPPFAKVGQMFAQHHNPDINVLLIPTSKDIKK